MTISIYYLVAITLLILILNGVFLYTKFGGGSRKYQEDVKRYVRKYQLKTRSKEQSLSVEFLRQHFLSEYPMHRGLGTEEFCALCAKYLKYVSPDEEMEDGGFYVNPDSEILIPPLPVEECEPLPKDFLEV